MEQKGAGLSSRLATYRGDAQRAGQEAARKRDEARRTRSDSFRRLAENAALRAEQKVADATKQVARIEGEIARNDQELARKRHDLDGALQTEQRERDREADRRRRTELEHAREVSRLSQTQILQHVAVPTPKAEQLRVLYLTASPTGEARLRVDREFREVQIQLRAQKYRDLVVLEHRPAATALDIIDGLNDVRPHIVHISAHGDTLALLLDDTEGATGRPVSFPLLARILAGTDSSPTLTVLNACQSLEGADDLLLVVPVVVGMAESVSDTGAIVFASRFYAAIASAQSIGSALAQAKAALELAVLDDPDIIEVRHRDDADSQTLILVRPGSMAA